MGQSTQSGPLRRLGCALVAAMALPLALSPAAGAQAGGAQYEPPVAPALQVATIVAGKAVAPAAAPTRVKRVIAAANRLVRKPYRWGGGHRPFGAKLDKGYDCSGAVSYGLYGGRFLAYPMASGPLMRWEEAGPGRWITVYANRQHTYLVVAGLRFDTSMHDADAPGPATGPRWSRVQREPAAFRARHPRGF